MSLPDVVHRVKSLTTARYRQGVAEEGWPGFCGRLWQRNYYEHSIRAEDELDRIRRYIGDNPFSRSTLARTRRAGRGACRARVAILVETFA